jgi:hypothetical protein
VRDALLDWAGVYWPNNPPRSLEELANRLPEQTRAMIMQLSASLYSPEHIAWDGKAIYGAIKTIPKVNTARNSSSDDSLEPLYR